MTRPAVVVALPSTESATVCAELEEAGFVVLPIEQPRELERLLEMRKDIGLAVLDGEIEEDVWRGLRAGPARCDPAHPGADRRVAAGLRAPDDGASRPARTTNTSPAPTPPTRSAGGSRPCASGARRWTTAAGRSCRPAASGVNGWNGRATTIAVFNPKGGVGKTTVATNLASALQLRKGKSVLLIDADTVTGHVTTSLGIDAVRTVADSWRDEAEGGPVETLLEIASAHPSGMKVVALTDSPLHTDVLDPARLTAAITAARAGVDVVVIDLHPSYSTLNQAIFDEADRILVPVTPDVPAIRAAVQLRDVAGGLGCRERLAMVINRANSGVTVEDMERTVGMPALALIRSGGLHFVRAANEGRTVVEHVPQGKDHRADFDVLADRVLGSSEARAERAQRLPLRGAQGTRPRLSDLRRAVPPSPIGRGRSS